MARKRKKTGWGKWLKTKPATITFAIVALIAGLFFVSGGIGGGINEIQGNLILDKSTFILNPSLSIIGFLLIICSIVLSAYSIKQKR